VVLIVPDQFVTAPQPNAVLIAVHPRRQSDPDFDTLPAADLPPLGSTVMVDGVEGTVVALDVPRRMVTVRVADEERTLDAEQLKK